MPAPYLQRFTVPFEYPVFFTEDAFAPANPALEDALCRREPSRRHRALVLLDEGLAVAVPSLSARIVDYADARSARIELAAAPVVVPGGEAAKNDPAAPARLQKLFREVGLDRHSFVVIVGGGAFLDLAGYAAATSHRGLRVVRLPSTVLSQNDSGVGVKNGVNAFGAKNFLGTFAPPFAVVNDLQLLDSLPARDRVAGIAEAVKVALIRDAAFFGWLEGNAAGLRSFERRATGGMIRRGAELHLAHIATGGDPFESGTARPLDFGHWAAHTLEIATAHRLRHGEAVAIGIALDTRYSVETGLLAAEEGERVFALLAAIGLPLWDEALGEKRGEDGTLAVLAGLAEFREHLGGALTVPMLGAIGRSVDVDRIDAATVGRCVEWLRARANANARSA